jgi:ABC-3C biological conflict system middle component
MILPGKHIKQDRALLAVGGDILSVLDGRMNISEIWRRVQDLRNSRENSSPLSFDWFVLALTFLFAVSAVASDGEQIVRSGTKQ